MVNSMSDDADCLECRLIGGLSLLGSSAYVYYNNKGSNFWSRSIISTFAAALGVVGIFRLADRPPFAVSKKMPADNKINRTNAQFTNTETEYIIGKYP